MELFLKLFFLSIWRFPPSTNKSTNANWLYLWSVPECFFSFSDFSLILLYWSVLLSFFVLFVWIQAQHSLQNSGAREAPGGAQRLHDEPGQIGQPAQPCTHSFTQPETPHTQVVPTNKIKKKTHLESGSDGTVMLTLTKPIVFTC